MTWSRTFLAGPTSTCSGSSPRADRWTSAIHYDPGLGLVLIHDGRSNVWALRFDRRTAKMTRIAD
ncbi:MAG: hypothetical protein AMS14_07800 [Planctomycetes bacterium DG_20]|nr:MAG: hypothetical protein AMS14_07800 [Planctomycetes bacterium DG_20]